MSRWAHWSRGTEEKGMGFGSFLQEAPVNTGNPSAAMGPSERAASLGLQSNGKGGYVDPNTGQVVARTVNNELIFYDSNRATGGAIADGDGGAALTQAQPSWADPLTGMLTTPPSKAETPSEIAAIPDAVPSTAPFGYNAFMKQKKMAAYQQNTVEPQLSRGTPDELEQEQEQQQQGDPGQQAAFATEDVINEAPTRMGDSFRRLAKEKGLDPESLQARVGEAPPSPIQGYVARAREQGQQAAPQVQQKNTQTPAQPKAFQPSLGLSGKKPTTPTPQEMDTNGDGEVDLEEMRQAALNAYQGWTTKKKTADTRMSEQFEPMMQALNRPGVNPQLRNRLMQTMLTAFKYQGRDNEASSNINKSEFHALRDRKDRIMKAYSGEDGDGSTHNLDAIREFQKELQDQDLGDDFDDIADSALAALPPQLQKIFSGGDMSAKQGFRKYLRQHGKGGYTGLPLGMDTMQMEHFVDFSQAQETAKKAKAEGRDMTPEEQEFYDFVTGEENQFWSRQGPNETKSSQNIKSFFENSVDPMEKLGDEFFDFRELQLDPARLKLKEQEKDLISKMFDRDDDGNAFLPEMDEEGFGALRESLDRVYGSEKNQLTEALQQAFDKKGLMKLTPKKFQAAIDDQNNPDVSEDDRTVYDMLQQLKGKVGGYNHDFSRRFLEGLGLSSHFQQSERARSTPVSPAFYKALAPKFVGKSREEQKALKEKLSEIISGANSTANGLRGQGLGDKGIREGLYANLLSRLGEEGIFGDDDYDNNKDLMKLRKKFLKEEDMSMFDMDGDGNFEMEDIMEIIKELLKMEQYNKPGKTFESFMA
jgi:hypothetical protein